jgi:uncharacterized membrane-anchored protein
VTSPQLRQEQYTAYGRHPLSKVPQVTVIFWITKVLTTGMGETTSDYLAHRLGPFTAAGLGFIALVASLVVQFRVRRYRTWVYWTAVVMVAVFGTMAADGLHIELHVPYSVSTPFFAVALAVIFALWYRSEGTLSIHSIYTRRREMFYWATVLATFALGTAAGDLTAVTLHLGYLTSGIFFTVVIAIPAVAHWRFNLNPILAFWFAYIVTRPLGASYADWMALPRSWGGLGLGRGPVSLGLTVVIVGFVAYLAATHQDVEERAARGYAGDPAARGYAGSPAMAGRRAISWPARAPQGRHAGTRRSASAPGGADA